MKSIIKKILKEEFDHLSWADSESLGDIGAYIGDVFYIIDNGDWDRPPLSDSHKPNRVRYIIVVTNVTLNESGDIIVGKKLCYPNDVTYNPKDYTIKKCMEYHDSNYNGKVDYIAMDKVIELIDKKYWRLMGNSKN